MTRLEHKTHCFCFCESQCLRLQVSQNPIFYNRYTYTLLTSCFWLSKTVYGVNRWLQRQIIIFTHKGTDTLNAQLRHHTELLFFSQNIRLSFLFVSERRPLISFRYLRWTNGLQLRMRANTQSVLRDCSAFFSSQPTTLCCAMLPNC